MAHLALNPQQQGKTSMRAANSTYTFARNISPMLMLTELSAGMLLQTVLSSTVFLLMLVASGCNHAALSQQQPLFDKSQKFRMS
jgi:hypothetical protein